MVLLKDNIYCKKTAFDDAMDFSRKSATSVLRRLAEGVFKRDAILKCTFSGRPPSAQGKDKQAEQVDALDRTARTVVKEYCENYAIRQGWPRSKKNELRAAMSQWLGELKRAEKKMLN
ncbi:uncharacterized protein LOC130675423 [Microplitis mediator]|uniref:uncharacterized protein LOC130669753 n=1 Tax=Microplitis mediator TaxID=375433 RepID=UPI002554FF07|nr:uncharacterized protein LOC130669753 [Microplitis mediator]XP_057337095.1 uncharacterized protein LOC130675423 [Microplitis mediator]